MTTSAWDEFALLLVDVQHDFWNKELEEAAPAFQSNVAQLLRYCRNTGIEVIHLREVFNTDRSDWLPRYLLRGRSPGVRGTTGASALEVAKELPGEQLIEKQTQDGFHKPELLDYLHRRNKRFVLVAGLVTSVCVLFTAVSAVQKGILAAVITDCCADYPEAHAMVLKRYRGWLLDFATLGELPERLAEWQIQIRSLTERRAEVAAAKS